MPGLTIPSSAPREALLFLSGLLIGSLFIVGGQSRRFLTSRGGSHGMDRRQRRWEQKTSRQMNRDGLTGEAAIG